MKYLYDEIKKRFPEADIDEYDIDTPYIMMVEVSNWLKSKEVNCKDSKIIERIEAFQNWCFDQEEGNDASDDICTIYYVGFYEDLFKNQKTQVLIPHLTTREALISNRSYIVSWCGQKEYDNTLKLMSKKKNRSK